MEDARSIEIAGQNENEIGGLGSFREYQKVSEIRQRGLPADGGEQQGEQDEGEQRKAGRARERVPGRWAWSRVGRTIILNRFGNSRTLI